MPGFSGAFALDDYGTGYSNELNLLELSPRYIKIDISIIRGIEKDPDKQQIVSNIVAYAHARSMQILAEGIEEEIQLRKVLDLGVDLLQGYYLHRIRSAGCHPRCQRRAFGCRLSAKKKRPFGRFFFVIDPAARMRRRWRRRH